MVVYDLATFNATGSQYRLSRSRPGSPRHSLASSFLAKTMVDYTPRVFACLRRQASHNAVIHIATLDCCVIPLRPAAPVFCRSNLI